MSAGATERDARRCHPAGKRLLVARRGALLGIQILGNAAAGLAASTVALVASSAVGLNQWLRLSLALIGLANLGVVVMWLRHGSYLLRAHLPVVREHKTKTKTKTKTRNNRRSTK